MPFVSVGPGPLTTPILPPHKGIFVLRRAQPANCRRHVNPDPARHLGSKGGQDSAAVDSSPPCAIKRTNRSCLSVSPRPARVVRDNPIAGIGLSLDHPLTQPLRPDPELGPQCLGRRPRRAVLTKSVKSHPGRTLTLLHGVPLGHDLHRSQEAKRHQTGTFHDRRFKRSKWSRSSQHLRTDLRDRQSLAACSRSTVRCWLGDGCRPAAQPCIGGGLASGADGGPGTGAVRSAGTNLRTGAGPGRMRRSRVRSSGTAVAAD